MNSFFLTCEILGFVVWTGLALRALIAKREIPLTWKDHALIFGVLALVMLKEALQRIAEMRGAP